MKIFITSFVSLLLGVFIGYHIGWQVRHRHAVSDANKIGAQMIYLDEAFDRDRASDAIQAIQFIESGANSNAVQLLLMPIGQYYRSHADLVETDEQTKGLLALIERLAATNAVIAGQIHKK